MMTADDRATGAGRAGDGDGLERLPTTDSQILLGLQLGKYKIENILGEGPRAVVYQGTHAALRRTVAIKILKPGSGAEAFLEAGRAASVLLHPNIVQIFDVVAAEGQCAVVMQLQNGSRTLAAALDKGVTLSSGACLQLAAEACGALMHAAGKGVTHGNLKPENVFIDPAGSIKLSDFGHEPAVIAAQLRSETEIRYGLYLAPERLLGEGPTALGDLFSLGVLLFQAATGFMPFSPREVNAFLAGGAPLPKADACAANPGVASGLSDLAGWLLACDPRMRPQSYGEVLDAVAAIAREQSGRASTGSVAELVARLDDIARPDKRRYRRLRSGLDVRVRPRATSGNSAVMLIRKLRNLSENGAFISTAEPLPEGSVVSLEFDLESGARVNVLGVVRWVDGGNDSPGMGVQFVEVSSSDKRGLKDFVDEKAFAEMAAALTQSQMHRALLRLILYSFGQTLSLERLLGKTGSSRPLLTKVLEDFQRFGLVHVEGDGLDCLQPGDERVPRVLWDALKTAEK